MAEVISTRGHVPARVFPFPRMTVEQDALWARICGFSFDDQDDCRLDFAARLGREQGWSASHTQRVIDEYRRFIFLAVSARHVVTPSEDVDQAWHLHLIYTRSYWERLCRDLLRQPVHHAPTTGGRDESARFAALYDKTLASYTRFFGETPPADLWPPPDQRFAKVLVTRSVNQAQAWIIPKPGIFGTTVAVVVAIAVVGMWIL